MPKATRNSAPRPSPMEEVVTPAVKLPKVPVKTPKPRKMPVITSNNHDLPIVHVDEDTMADLLNLKTRKPNENSTPVDFNAVFLRQTKFGAWEFVVSDDTNDDLREAMDNLHFADRATSNLCLKLNEYSGRHQISGKLSKLYKDNVPAGSQIPVPKEGDPVHLTGRMELANIKKKETCYFQIDHINEITLGH